MRNMILLCAIAASASVFAASPAATQQWVRNYVATNITKDAKLVTQSVTNGNVRLTISNATECVVVEGEIPFKLALVATNVTSTAISAGVTNGMMFAWDGNGEWHNGPSGVFIVSVSNECFRFDGHNSVRTNGYDSIPGYFDINGMKIPNSIWDSLIPQSVSSFTFSLFPSAYADTWKNMGEAWYAPADVCAFVHPKSYTITDAKTLEVKEFQVWYDNNGIIHNNYDEVVESMRQSVATIGKDLSGVVNGVVNNSSHLEQLDEEFNILSKNLDLGFAEVYNKFSELEIEDEENGVKKNLTRKGSDDSKTIYATHNIFNVAAAQADGKSISSNKNDRLEIHGYSDISKDTQSSEKVIPYFGGAYYGVLWKDIGFWADDKTIEQKKNNKYVSSIGLKDWDTPSSQSASCAESLATQLKEGHTSHYVLTKHKQFDALHYTEVGKLLTGSAIKIFGTEGDPAVVGSGSTTNTLTFASAGDSNVKVTVSGTGGDATVTIGVYYK